jgi:hypothetical protein
MKNNHVLLTLLVFISFTLLESSCTQYSIEENDHSSYQIEKKYK